MPSHCGVEARLEARPVLPRFICPICGAWQYVRAEKPEQWVDDHFVDANKMAAVAKAKVTADHFRDTAKMPTVKESLTIQPDLFQEVSHA